MGSRHYEKIVVTHKPGPLRKSTYQAVWNKEEKILKKAAADRFRTFADFNFYLFFEWDVAAAQFENVRFSSKACRISKRTVSSCVKAIRNHQYRSLCVNDNEKLSEEDADQVIAKVRQAFESILPQPCEFERSE